MALTPLTNPSSSPSGITDYQYQNALIAANLLDPDMIFPIDFDNNEIVKGKVFNLSGTALKAVSAEPITGTKSYYVKIDHTAYTASYVADLTGVSWDDDYNGYYDSSGDLYVFDEIVAYQQNEIQEVKSNYAVLALSALAIVYNVGFFKMQNETYLTGYVSGNPDITKLSDTRIALTLSAAGAVYLAAFDLVGETWVQVGNALAIQTNSAACVLCALSSSRVAVAEQNDNVIQAYDFDGTNWSTAGSSFSLSMTDPDICALSSSRIVFVDRAAYTLQAYDFNGSTWSAAGNPYVFGAAATGYHGVAALGAARVILDYDTGSANGYIHELQILDFDGTDWSQTGNTLEYSHNRSLIPRPANIDGEYFIVTHRLGTIKCRFDGTDIHILRGTYSANFGMAAEYIADEEFVLADYFNIVRMKGIKYANT